jgi:iron transport multicopper oxidase
VLYRYRFRIVSISCDPNYTFSIDGHNMTVIEVDGINTKAYTVDNIQIFAGSYPCSRASRFILGLMLCITGQRYSVVLTANKAVGNYCTPTFAGIILI